MSTITFKFLLTLLTITNLFHPTTPLTLTLPPPLKTKIHTDPTAIKTASTDYGLIVTEQPAAVVVPTSVEDIRVLLGFSFRMSGAYTVAAKGMAHSVHGQAMALNGVVVDMLGLNSDRRIVIGGDEVSGYYADVGGEQLWVDVLNAALKRGLSPVSWTDYLYLSVGGTLSNAGISGQTHRRGPQISNVYELDVVTGKGEVVTCSKKQNPELFNGVLGGLGQFGIITRARIVLEQAKSMVMWSNILYTDFASFSSDQEALISLNQSTVDEFPDYIEGELLMDPNSLESYPSQDRPIISSLIRQFGIIYVLETAFYYDHNDQYPSQKLDNLAKILNINSSNVYTKNVTYFDFLNRVHTSELILRQQGLWNVPHPWLNLFVPKSGMSKFNDGVFKNILLKKNFTTSIVLVYPMNQIKWDDEMSAVIPADEEIFYTVAFLDASGFNNWQVYDNKNKEVLAYCESAGIQVKQYLGHHDTKEGWIKHFGSKWNTFQARKVLFDPKHILSPGQKIFN